MNENKAKGAAKVVVGEFVSASGEVFDDDEMRAEGAARQVVGRIQQTVGSIQETLGKVGGAYERVTDGANEVAGTVDPFVKERPYLSLGLIAAAGLLVGLLIAGRGPKIVYVRPRA